MPTITDSVGVGATNTTHDVAMVQFMLKVLTTSRGTPYFGGPYTSRYSSETARALSSFQSDRAVTRGTSGPGGAEVPGLVKPGGATWRALVGAFESVNAQYRAARVTEGVGIVYLAMGGPGWPKA